MLNRPFSPSHNPKPICPFLSLSPAPHPSQNNQKINTTIHSQILHHNIPSHPNPTNPPSSNVNPHTPNTTPIHAQTPTSNPAPPTTKQKIPSHPPPPPQKRGSLNPQPATRNPNPLQYSTVPILQKTKTLRSWTEGEVWILDMGFGGESLGGG